MPFIFILSITVWAEVSQACHYRDQLTLSYQSAYLELSFLAGIFLAVAYFSTAFLHLFLAFFAVPLLYLPVL